MTFVYSVTKRGWVFPGLLLSKSTESPAAGWEINNKRGAVCKHLPLS
ncbi:cruciferin [Escherichia coli]|nr:cruciferin [Escherichia coli]